MKRPKSCMEESILVCVYYGPNGERLIRRGDKLAKLLDCPLYVLTVDPSPLDAFDAEKSGYIESWQELCDTLDVDEFIIRDNEKRNSAKVIAEEVHNHNITQIIIGQSPQKRWQEIAKGSFANVLLRQISFVDVHIVSIDRSLRNTTDTDYEKGVRAFLNKENENYQLAFSRSAKNLYEGIFYKEIGTDFNYGIFKFINNDGKTCQVHVSDDQIDGLLKDPPNIQHTKK